MIGQGGDTWLRTKELLRLLLPAAVRASETARLDRLQNNLFVARAGRIVPGPEELLLFRFLEILPDYGLLESAPPLDDSARGYPRYRKTPLFDRFVRFDFGVDPPPRLDMTALRRPGLLR